MFRNSLINGKFLHNLNGWTADGATYLASDGNDHYGVAVLPTGAAIWQAFSVDGTKLQTLSISIHSLGVTLNDDSVTYTITDGNGETVISGEVHATDGNWTDNLYNIGLVEGTTYTITIENTAVDDVHIDDVWIWFVPVTRASIAAQVASKLGRIATERGLSTESDGELTEGDYTYPIDAALRTIGAIDEEDGKPSIRYVDVEQVQTLIETVRREVLERLQTEYAVEVDTVTGPYNQRLSQKSGSIGAILGNTGKDGKSSTGGAIIQRKINYD